MQQHLWLALTFTCVLCGSVAFGADDAATLLTQAKAATTAKNTVQAVSLYTSFLDKYPQDPRAMEASYSLAEVYLQMQDYVGAATHYKKVIDTAPQSEFATLAMFRVGEIPYLLEKYDTAKPLLLSFIQQRPYDPCNRFVLYYLGDIAMQRGEEKEAAYYFSECLQLFPTGERVGDARLGMAWVYDRQGKPQEADEIYRTMSLDTTKPSAEEALYRWGSAQRERGNNATAIATLESFLSRYPVSSFRSFVTQELVQALVATNRFSNALTLIPSITPATDETRYLQAVCLFGTERLSEADTVLRGIEQNPVFVDKALFLRANVAYKSRQWRDAVTKYETLLGAQYNQTAQRMTIDYWNYLTTTTATSTTNANTVQRLTDNEVMRAAGQLAISYAQLGDAARATALYTSLRSYSRDNAARGTILTETRSQLLAVNPSLALTEGSTRGSGIGSGASGGTNSLVAGNDEEHLQQAIERYTQRDYTGALAILEPLLGIEYLTIPTPRLSISYRLTNTVAPPALPGMGSLTPLTPLNPLAPVNTNKLTATSLNQACSLLTLCYAMNGDAVRAQSAMTMFKAQATNGDATTRDIVQQTEQLLSQVLASTGINTGNTPQPSVSQINRPGLTPLQPQQPVANNTSGSVPVGGGDIDAGDYRKTLQTARTLIKNRQYTQADALLTRLLSQDISGSIAAETLFLEAETLVALKRTSEAIPLYEQIIARHASSRYAADALWSLGLVYERRGDSVAASEYFQQLVEQFTDFAQIDGALYYLAWNDIDNGAGNRASGYLQRVDRQYPYGAYWSHSVWTLAWLAARANNPDGANDYLDKILSRAPDEAIYDRVLYLKGRLAMDRRSWEAASVAFQELRKVRPDSPFRDAADQATSLVRHASETVR